MIAFFGTFSSPKKSPAASIVEILSRYTNLVVELKDDPGSLNPMCPVDPIPSN